MPRRRWSRTARLRAGAGVAVTVMLAAVAACQQIGRPVAGTTERAPQAAAALPVPAPPTPATPSPTTDPAAGRPWSDPATWGGAVPAAGSQVVVPAGRTILLDVDPPALGGLQIDGTLVFAPGADRSLTSANVVVHGTLQVGTEAQAFPDRATITLTGGPDAADVMGMGSKVLGVMGGTVDLHGAPASSWTTMARTARPGDTMISVEDATGWSVGDRLVLTSSDQAADSVDDVTVTAVSGTSLTVTPALRFAHHGETETVAGVVVDERAHVGRLTRTVKIQGDEASSASGFGGHMTVMAGSTARIDGVEFDRMGQAGATGRYPFHFHTMRDATGSYLRHSSVHHSPNRAVTIHASDNVVVQDNVTFAVAGHAVFMEDGSETGNEISDNLVVLTTEPDPGARLLASDAGQASFWITNPANTVTGNVAAGSDGSCFFLQFDAELTEVPGALSAGARRATPFGRFADNTAYACGRDLFDDPRSAALFVSHYEGAVIEGFRAFHNTAAAIWNDGRTTITGAILSGNRTAYFDAAPDALVTGSTFVGRTSTTGVDQVTGVKLYDGRPRLVDNTFAAFNGPDDWAIGPLEFKDDIDVSTTAVNSRFVDSRPLYVTNTGDDFVLDVPAGDVDGVAGPLALVSPSPLLLTPGCQDRPAWHAAICPGNRYVTITGFAPVVESLMPFTATRSDGATNTLNAYAHSQGFIYSPNNYLTGVTYRLGFGQPLSSVPGTYRWGASGAHPEDRTGLEIPFAGHPASVSVGDGPTQIPEVDCATWAADPEGRFCYDAAAGLLHVTLGAGRSVQVTVAP